MDPSRALKSLLSPKMVAKQLAISTKTLRRHVRAGRIRYILIGAGERRQHIAFTEEAIIEFLHRRERRGRQN